MCFAHDYYLSTTPLLNSSSKILQQNFRKVVFSNKALNLADRRLLWSSGLQVLLGRVGSYLGMSKSKKRPIIRSDSEDSDGSDNLDQVAIILGHWA